MFTFVFDEISLPVVKRVILNYFFVVGLLCIVCMLWRIWKFMKLYEEFPTYPLLLHLMYSSIANKIPEHLPFTAYVFQQAELLSKRFEKEGIFLLWLPRPHLVVFGEQAVKIFSNEQAALNKASKYDVLSECFGSGLVTSNGEIWKSHRKMLNPVFHVEILKNKVSIFNKGAKILIEKLKDAGNETSIDALELIMPCSFGILCEYVLGLKMNIPENEEMIKNYTQLIKKASEMIVHRVCYPWLQFTFMKRYLPSGQKFTKTLEEIDNFTIKIISSIKKKIVSQKEDITCLEDNYWSDDSATRKSFAHILLDQHLKGNSFTMEDVKSEVTTFMSAGFDTISNALVWNLFLLGHDTDVQNQAYNEVNTIPEENIKYEDLTKLKYLECVIKETLRIYPPVPVYARKLHKDIQYGKYNVPKGTEIVFFPYTLHRNPEVYPDPEKFYPGRFMEIDVRKQSGNYTPFAEGIRNCIGKRFAMMEMKVILAYILRNYRITSLDRKEDVDLSWNIVLGPTRPLQFRFTPRNGL